MARSFTRTKLPLDRFAFYMGIDPLLFNQVVYDTDNPPQVCDHPMKQYAWQAADAIGREEVAMAIAQAEEDIERWTGYFLLPSWTENERLPVTRPANPALYNLTGLNVRGQRKTQKLGRGYLLFGGQRLQTLIEAGAIITWSDADNDGYEETGTISVTVPDDTTECSLRVYFPGQSGSDAWEIRPLKTVSIIANTAVITFRRELCVDPDLWEAVNPIGVDGRVDGNFIATVDVYEDAVDPQQQAHLEWERLPNSCGCGGSVCPECTIAFQTGCLVIRDHRLGIVHYSPATWDTDTEAFQFTNFTVARDPDRLRLWYFSGWQDQSRSCPLTQMDPFWEQTVTYLAASYLDRPICGCENLEAHLRKWREDLAFSSAEGSYQLSRRHLDNPIGTTRGAVQAWHRITQPGRQIASPIIA